MWYDDVINNFIIIVKSSNFYNGKPLYQSFFENGKIALQKEPLCFNLYNP